MITFTHRIKTIDLPQYAKEKVHLRIIPDNPNNVNEQAIESTINRYIPEILKTKTKNEVGVIVDSCGDLVVDIKGDRYSITAKPIFPVNNDSVLHRHPITIEPYVRSPLTLSTDDLRTFIKCKLFRIDAVDVSGGHYYMKRTPNTPNFNDKLTKSACEYLSYVDGTFSRLVKNGSLSTNKASNDFIKDCWERFAKNFKLEYFHQEGKMSVFNLTKQAINRFREW